MGLGYRNRIKIAPGIHINLSLSGVSMNIGVPGLNTTIGRNSRVNLGLPGTGITFRKSLKQKRRKDSVEPGNPPPPAPVVSPDNIISVDPRLVESGDLSFINQLYLEVLENKRSMERDRIFANGELKKARRQAFWSKVFLFGFLREIRTEQESTIAFYEDRLAEIAEDEALNFLSLDYVIDESVEEKYLELKAAFAQAAQVDKIWDINRQEQNNRAQTRSKASHTLRRVETTFCTADVEHVICNEPGLKLDNRNGADIYLYPSFVVFYQQPGQFAAIPYADLEVTFMAVPFIEESKVPRDATVIERTWKKVNKDGSRDKRFKENYQIPVAKYGELGLRHRSGIVERFQLSNYDAARVLYERLVAYQEEIDCLI